MQKQIILIALVCISVVLVTLLFIKWDTDIYMESTSPPPYDKVDLKISIDDVVVFNDTLQKNPFSIPTHIKHPMRIGFHNISISSQSVNLRKDTSLFIFFNQHITLYYGFDTTNIKPYISVSKGNGIFGYE